MTAFLIRLFIRSSDDPSDPAIRQKYGILASVTGICCNVLLFLTKFIVGTVLSSFSIVSDSFNNLSDASSSVISLVGTKLSNQPPDKEHPFGHGRIEYLSALAVAVIIIIVGVQLFQEAIGKILHPESTAFALIPVLILLLSIGVKLWMAAFYSTIGGLIHSDVLSAVSKDSRNDVLVTSMTLAVIVIEHFLPVHIDGFVSLIVSILVIWSGLSIARDTLEPLIGSPADPLLYDRIADLVLSTDGILSCHDLVIHNYGPGHYLSSIHAEVSSDLDLVTAHAIADSAERQVMARLGIELVVHIDPVDLKDPLLETAAGDIRKVLAQIDPQITWHDLHILRGKEHENLIFDILIPYGRTPQQEEELKKQIDSRLREENPHYHCHIRCDHSLIS